MSDAADHAAFIEKLRQSGIRVDREGRFVHEGAEVTHEGLRARSSSLARSPASADGRYVLRLDEHRFAYLDVDDTPLVARAARDRSRGRRSMLALSDGTEEPLDSGDADRRRRRRAARLGPRRPSRGAARELRRRRARRSPRRGATAVRRSASGGGRTGCGRGRQGDDEARAAERRASPPRRARRRRGRGRSCARSPGRGRCRAPWWSRRDRRSARATRPARRGRCRRRAGARRGRAAS